MAFIQDLPNEIMLKVINYLYIKDLVELGEVSKKISAICSDQSLWQKIIRSKDTPKLFHMDAQGCWIYDIDVPLYEKGHRKWLPISQPPLHEIRNTCRTNLLGETQTFELL